MKFWKKSLMARLVISFFLLSVVTVALVAFIAYAQARETLKQSVFDQLEAKALLKEEEFNRWVEDQRRTVDWLSQLPEIHTLTDSLANLNESDPDYDSVYKSLSEYLANMVATQPNLQEVLILVGDEGKIIVSTDKTHKGRVVAPHDQEQADNYYEKASLGRKVVQNVYLSPFTNEPTLTIAIPLITKAGERVGVLAAHLNLARMDRIILEHTGLGESSETYLVDQSCRFVTAERFGRDEYPGGVSSQGIDAAVQKQNGGGLYDNYAGQAVIGVYHWIPDRELALLSEMRQSEAFQPARELAGNILLVGLVSAGLLAIGVILLARQIARPILAITETARQVTAGDLDSTAPVMTQDEIGVLAVAFNTMQARLRQSHLELEQRVAERTVELQQANLALSQRALQLETSSQVGQQATSILDLDKLLEQVVSLIQNRFGYYFVGVWLMAENQAAITLRAGAGQAGRALHEQDFCISAEQNSIVSNVCKRGSARMIDDVRLASDYVPLPELPDTQSELVLPLRKGEQVMGVLDIESDQPAAFSQEDVLVLQTLANQIAVAIRNARLYESEQRRRRLAESLEQVGRVLSSSLDMREVPRLIIEQLKIIVPYSRGSVMLQFGSDMRIVSQHGFPDGARAMGLNVAIREGDVFEQLMNNQRPLLVDDVTQEPGWYQVEWLPLHHSWLGIPLISQDRVIGMISLVRPDVGAFSPDDAALAQTFAGQATIAVENARLYDEVKQRTIALQEAYERLERLDRTKLDFISIISHELRTPLTILNGYSQLLLKDPLIQSNTNHQQMISSIRSGALRLQDIVNSMLDIAKIDNRSLEILPETLQLFMLVEQLVTSEFETALQERQIELEIVDSKNLPAINADHNALKKVFYQLIVNAIKYTPDGGKVTISGQTIGPNQHDLVEGGVKITISDTGIGIAPESQELIFAKFYQTGQVALHSTGKTKFKGGGPGLGLPIARGIVEAHGGTLWVESAGYDEEICPGSDFHIVLPLHARPAAAES